MSDAKRRKTSHEVQEGHGAPERILASRSPPAEQPTSSQSEDDSATLLALPAEEASEVPKTFKDLVSL